MNISSIQQKAGQVKKQIQKAQKLIDQLKTERRFLLTIEVLLDVCFPVMVKQGRNVNQEGVLKWCQEVFGFTPRGSALTPALQLYYSNTAPIPLGEEDIIGADGYSDWGNCTECYADYIQEFLDCECCGWAFTLSNQRLLRRDGIHVWPYDD